MATDTLNGRNIVFSIYNEDGTPFHNLVLRKSVVDSIVMSLGDKITGDVFYKNNTLQVTMKEYVEYNGIRFSLVNPPTIVREGLVSDNGELKGMTKYSFEFYHPMYQLSNFPFTDVATKTGEEKYLSQNKSFPWIGKPQDYIDKLNKNLQGTVWYVRKSDRFPVEKDDELSDVQQFDNVSVAEAIKRGYEIWGTPYIVSQLTNNDPLYVQGKRFVVEYGLPSNEIYENESARQLGTPYVFQMGQGVGLKNNSRTPRNNKIVTRIAGYGSEDNVPYGYPQIVWTGNQNWDYTIENDPNNPLSYPIYKGIVGGQYVKLIKHPFTRTHLMPSIFTETVNKKVNPNADGYDPTIEIKDYYDAVATQEYPYVNEINLQAPSYESHEFADIKPELDADRNTGIVSAVPLNADLTPADHWDDTMDDDGNYLQSYFQITLPQLSFDLYACAAITQEMQINMRSGACIGCTFPVQVDWDDYKRNFYDEDGNFVPDGEQRDLTKYPKSNLGQISVVVQKDNSTFGILMPNIYQQPKANDLFVFIGISLPLSYIANAEERLDDAMKTYMLENNVYYFDYPLKFDEHFLATHTNILEQIRPNSIIHFDYGGVEQQLFVKQITVKYGNAPLPQYDITLTDNVEVVLNQIGQVAEDVEKLTTLIAILRQSYGRNVWSELAKKLSKTQDDTAAGFITMLKGLQVGANFVPDILGEGGVLRMRDDGKVELVTDILYARVKAYFDSVEIREYQHTGGNRIASVAGNKICRVAWFNSSNTELEQTQANLASVAYFRCFFRASDGEDTVKNNWVVGDQAYCHITSVTTSSDNPEQKGLNQKHLWRLVIGRNTEGTLTEDGEAYIDLSNRTTETISGTSYTGYQSGSDVPEAQDDIIQLGNVNDTTRQGAIVEFVTGTDAPSYQIYQGINSFSLNNKNQIGFGYNTGTGRAYHNVYGDFRFGSRNDNESHIKYNQATKQLDIKAHVEFTNTDEELDALVQEHQSNYDDSEVREAISDLNDVTDNLQSQIDGSIETVYGEDDPSIAANDPYKNYTTAEKEKHLGDNYYNTLTGYAYRYTKKTEGGVTTYYWTIITDSGITEAIGKAGEALNLAGTKGKIFSTADGVLPTPPYNLNDVWVNATYPANGSTYSNEILKCVSAKSGSQAAAISDWDKASKYTDDSKFDGYINAFLNGSGASGDSATAAAIQKAIASALGVGTVVAGGLLLTSLIGMRQYNGSGDKTDVANYTTWAGISGQYNANVLGGGMAAWYGGGMLDKETLTTQQISQGWNTLRWAKGVDRFDGSGYRADGNITWNANGALTIKNITTLSDSNNNNILNELATFNSAFTFGTSGQGSTTALYITPQVPFEELYIGTSNANKLAVATEKWVNDNYVSISFFERLFNAYNGNTKVSPNSTATIDNIKAMFGFWTEQYISALGKGEDESHEIGVLNDLNDVTLTNPTANQILVFDGTHWRNQNQQSVYELPVATTTTLGGIMLGYGESGKNYAVKVDANGKAYVTVNWTDTTYDLSGYATKEWVEAKGYITSYIDTKNTAGSTNNAAQKLFLVGALSQAANPQTYSNVNVYIGTDNCLYSNGAKVLTSHQSLAGYATEAWVNANFNNYVLPAANTTDLGGIKVGYTSSGKNYKVQLDSSNNAYVNVPWENTWRGIQNNLTSDSTTDSLSAAQGKALKGYIDTLNGYFSNGVAKSAAKLTTVSKTAWGQTFWTSGGVPTSISGALSSVTNITMSGFIKIGDAYLTYDSTNNAIRVSANADGTGAMNFYARGGVSALGETADGQAGVGDVTWALLASQATGGRTIHSSYLTDVLSIYATRDWVDGHFGYTTSGKNYAIQLDANGKAYVNVPWSDTTYTLPTASASTLGGVKVGSTLAIASGVLNLPTTGVTAGTYKRVTVDAYGRVTSGDNSDIDTNTWRDIYVGGTSKVGTGNDTKAINYKAGSNVAISYVPAGTGSGQSGSANYFDVVISATDTTYSAATQSAAGLMSAADKTKLDGIATGANNYSLPLAASGTRGGIQIGYAQSGKNYPVQLSSEKAYVNVPWENTTYSANNGVGLSGTTFYNSGVRAVSINGNYLRVNTNGTNADHTIPYATNADTVDGKHYSDIILSNGRNLVRNYNTETTSSAYQVWGNHVLTETVNSGDKITITIEYSLSSGATKTWLRVYTGGGYQTIANFDATAGLSHHVQSVTTNMMYSSGYNDNAVCIYYGPSDKTGACTIHRVKVERGDHFTGWSPAPEDIITSNIIGSQSVFYATSAGKLQTARTINGTSFDGSANITTANWGTARNISIADSDSTNTGSAVSVNGSAAVTLKLPATIKATLSGNAASATKLANSRTLWGQSFDGSANVSGNMTGVGNITMSANNGTYIQIGAIQLKYDANNDALYVVHTASNKVANIYAQGGVSALGMSADGSAGVGDVTWALLAATDTRQINLTHITTALGTLTGGTTDSTNKKYAVYKNSSNQLFVDVPWVSGSGTVTSIKVGSTSYTPTSGVISLPAYPTSLPASDVYAWAKASTKPTYAYSEITGTPTIPAAANNGTFSIKTLVGSTTTTISDFTANQSTADDFTLVQGANVTFTLDTTNRKLTISATDTTYSAGTGLSLSGTTFSIKRPSSGAWFDGTAYVGGDGVMEVGRYIDFHSTSDSTLDYSARIDCGTSTTVRTFTLPDSEGTILTSGNSSVSKSGETLTVKINGTSQSLTNTNTTYTNGTGLSLSGTTFSINSTYQTYISNGNTAYNWGNHANAGYLLKSGGTMNDGAVIARAGHSNTWVYGRNNPIIKTTSHAGYDTILSMKTGSGTWDLGAYNDDTIYLTFITDTDYNAGRNGYTYQLTFPKSEGTLALTNQIPTNNNQLTNGAGYITSSGSCASAATCTGNAASATKLQTARTIWGKSFDGTANISGSLTGVSNITMTGYVKIGDAYLSYNSSSNSIRVSKNSDGSGAVNFYATGGVSALGAGQDGSSGGGDVYWSQLKSSSNTEQIAYSHLTDAFDAYTDRDTLPANTTQGVDFKLNGTTSSNPRIWWFIGGVNSVNLTMKTDGSLHLTSTSLPTSTYTSFRCGASYASSYNNTSDMRLKNRIKDTDLRVEQIANAPSFKYLWIDKNVDTDLHVGSSAQYWNSILPEVVTKTKDEIGTLFLQYGVAALISAITVARKVVKHEEEIALLKTRVSALERENGELINEIEQLKIA